LKEQWHKWVEKIDALALRERALIFLMLSVVMLTPVKMFLLDPMRAKHSTLTKQIAERQKQISALGNEKIMHGQPFSSLDMRLIQVEKVGGYFEFNLNSVEPQQPGGDPAKVVR